MGRLDGRLRYPNMVAYENGLEIGGNELDPAPFGYVRLRYRDGVLQISIDGSDWATFAGAAGSGVQRVTKQFTTSDPIEDTFPLAVELPVGFVVTGAKYVRLQNITNPSATRSSPVDIDWTQTGSSLSLKYVFGLEPGVEYLLTLEVSNA